MKTALIVGSEGQDGRLLCFWLESLGYDVWGLSREKLKNSNGHVKCVPRVLDLDAVTSILNHAKPQEVYFLAAYHQSSEAKEIDYLNHWDKSEQINVQLLLHFLKSIKQFTQGTRLFYASSSHVFGNPTISPQDENTIQCPINVYGMTKMMGAQYCQYFRRNYGIFATTGILYNHESEYRRPEFISKKIVRAAIEIHKGISKSLSIGNLDAIVDWGDARDYVKAMHKILNTSEPSDYVIATGRGIKVSDFLNLTFSLLNLDWKKYTFEDPSQIRFSSAFYIGNPAKINLQLGWSASTPLVETIKRMMVAEDMETLRY